MVIGHAACVQPGRRAGTGVGKYCTYICRELKTGQQKVQLYYEEDPLCPSSYIIYLLWKQHRIEGNGHKGYMTCFFRPKR